jgi:phospholipid transport system substrate-binding protein
MKFLKTTSALVGVLVLSAAAAFAVSPMEQLKPPLEEVISILKDPELKGQKEVQREKIWKIMPRIFDFTEISRRTLARNWLQFNPQQRMEFTDAFTTYLGNIYLDRLQVDYQNEELQLLEEDMIAENRAVVKSRIVRERDAIPVDYSLIQRNGEWRVFDVIIEGVSMVSNYRQQFDRILFKESPEQLIDKLKKNKIEDVAPGPKTGKRVSN